MIRAGRLSGKKTVYILLLAIYVIINLVYLTGFPFVHSDESWLSGLSRNIMESRDYSVAEPFFDLKPRYPHAIKIIFHSIQILFIRIIGYGIFSVRLISLIFGVLTLICFFKLCKYIFGCEKAAFAGALLLSVEVQFIYASHFARQEIIMVFVLVFAMKWFITRIDKHKFVNNMILGTIIGLSIGIHPNSFVISLPFGFIYLYHIIKTKKLHIKDLLFYSSTIGVFALGFVLLSIYFDPDFISNYSSYGSEFEVLNPIAVKIDELKYFYLKLYYGVSGTYYTPDIRFELISFAVVLILAVFKVYYKKNRPENEKVKAVILSILAVNTGIVLIGRYNQTSVVFQFPLFFILMVFVLRSLKNAFRWTAVSLMVLVLMGNTICNARPYISGSYKNYLYEISRFVEKDDMVLANLNTEYYFKNDKLYDYRNLAYLRDNNMSFEQYIRKNKIKFIIYSEEMDLIYQLRPRWNGIYGNIFPYYEDMQNFLQNSCEKAHEFTDSVYGIRIARYINEDDWKITIYRVE